jgi:ribonuclease T2
LAAPAFATPSCTVDPARTKVYRLELTVPATFCRRAENDPACEDFPKASALQLHGLWPNYQSGYPEGHCPSNECRERPPADGRYCDYPAPPGVYQATWWPELKPYMAATEKCLERHEWVKHGTCSPMSADRYFRWSLETTRRIAGALSGFTDQRVTRRRFDEQVRQELPDLAGSLRLNCKRGALSSLYVLYEWGDPPRKPIPTRDEGNHFGNCRDSFTIPSRPHRD